MDKSRKNRAYTFVITLTFLLVVTFALSSFERDYIENPVDFSSLTNSDFLIQLGLTRRQSGSVKLGYAKNFAPPKIGLFGNHQFNNFGLDAFPEKYGANNDYFFNHWFANLSLPEIKDYISYLADRNKLPTDTVIVQITTPNNDNGGVIIDRHGELPFRIQYYFDKKHNMSVKKKAITLIDNTITEVTRTLTLQNFLSSVFSKGTGLIKISKNECELRKLRSTDSKYSSVIDRLPDTLKNYLGEEGRNNIIRRFCKGVSSYQAAIDSLVYRFDGSMPQGYMTGIVKWPPLETSDSTEGPINRKPQKLFPGDEETIARQIREISRIVIKNGRKLVFVVPPVYGEYGDTAVDRVFSRALKLIKNSKVHVIDHRNRYTEAKYFYDNDHQKREYFVKLVEELFANNLIPE